MTTETSPELDALCREDPVIRLLLRNMRDGAGMDLQSAVRELSELPGVDTAGLDAAAARIAALIREIQMATRPRAVVAGNIESWYAGPRAEDPNWSSFVAILRDEGWQDDELRDLDISSTKVVAHLPNPHGLDSYHAKGLVLGYVQSGKTTNFTAVIAKAADAGYRIFIILSGIHKALRSQTENRLTEQLSGPQSHRWYTLTNDDGFQDNANVDALAAAVEQRSLGVVLKNPYWLRRLKRWFEGARPEHIARCPVLIIDDEADQASVNTAKPERQPTTINRLIRETLETLPKVAYVGYTATPFANVLIDPSEPQDLYPSDFIVDLPRPAAYIGPEAIFGREPLEFDADEIPDDGHDFIRTVPATEIAALRPKGSSTRHEFEPEMTESLDGALRYFLMSTAARRARGVGNPHATALVHTSQHVDVHNRMAEAIDGHLRQLGARLARGDVGLMTALKEMWAEECDRVPAEDWGLDPVGWDAVAERLVQVASDASVVVDNSSSQDRLHFDPRNPRVLVAVGGNTLSRGLTLEGLSVSFFVRTASAYDTLLQMGRWFGYRSGYADLTRIWMTDEMREWFHHLATVEQEIRYEIERYESEHLTPDELGPRIRTHPKLAITAAAKMRNARTADASYSGRRIQTILFNHRDRDWLTQNLDAARSLVQRVSSQPPEEIRPGINVIREVPSAEVTSFLASYRFHENSRDLNTALITRYIEGRMADGELTRFNVVVMGHGSGGVELGDVDLGLPSRVACINRARIKVIGGTTYADIKSLMSSSDRAVDLDVRPIELKDISREAIARLRNTPAEDGRGDASGLLLLYPISKNSVPVKASVRTREPLDAVEHVIGVGLVFPVTLSKAASVDYVTADVRSIVDGEVEVPDDTDFVDESENAAE
jgi:hypothetical protein